MKTAMVTLSDLAKPCPLGHKNCWLARCRLGVDGEMVTEFISIEHAKREIARRVRALEERAGMPLTSLRAAIRRGTRADGPPSR